MNRLAEKNVLILEPHAVGHHGPYLRWIAGGLIERGLDVTVVTLPESLIHPSVQTIHETLKAEDRERLKIIKSASGVPGDLGSLRGKVSLAKREFGYWSLFRAWYKEYAPAARPSVVFLPYLDYCLYAIGLLGSPFGNSPWAGIAMRPSFHYPELGIIAPRPSLASLKKALFFRVLRNRSLRCLLTIDEPLREFLAKTEYSEKAVFLPEPAKMSSLPGSQDAKRRLGLPLDRKLILVYGAITERKGLPELLHAVMEAAFPQSVDVLVAGRISPEIDKFLSCPRMAKLIAQGRIRLFNRFIDTVEEPFLFAAADIVWLGYRKHYGSSGVLAQAASARRPVISCEEGVLGWQTRRHSLGAVIDVEDPALVADTVSRTLAQPKGDTGIFDPPDYSDALQIVVGAIGLGDIHSPGKYPSLSDT